MTRFLNRTRSPQGFSLLETLLTLCILAIVGGMGTAQLATVRRQMQGDGAMRLVMTQLTTAREMAVTQRRNMEIKFIQPNPGFHGLQVIRHEVPIGTTTLITVYFEGSAQFALPSGGDTPDGFGVSAPITFPSSATTLTFSSEGTLIDTAGNPVNGSIFLAISNVVPAQRAVTVMGSTGRIRGYKWVGGAWKRV